MSTNPRLGAKKAFLYTLILSVGLSAILGVVGILRGTGGWFELRILLTTVTISAASICGLACGAYLETRKGKLLPLAGIILALFGGALIIAGMWIDPQADAYWRLTAATSTFAVALAHLSLLSMARLAKRFRWARYAGYFFVLGVAALIVSMILANSSGGEGIWKLLAVTAIGAASMTVLTPIFHWLSRHDPRETELDPAARVQSIDEEIDKLKARIEELERQKQQIS